MDGELSEDTRRELLLHYDEIRDELIRAVRCPHLGEDLAQEAYYRAFRAFARRSRPRDSLAWLHAIARNVMRDHFRRIGRGVDIERNGGDLLVDPHDDLVADAVPWDVDPATLAQAVNELPPIARALIIGFYFNGKGCDALSIEFGIERNYVKVQLYRARKKLRARLNKLQRGSP
jgi:RNA polymerase sigma-70 factor (ECF subfamily)